MFFLVRSRHRAYITCKSSMRHLFGGYTFLLHLLSHGFLQDKRDNRTPNARNTTQVLCSEYSCAFAGSDAQMQQLIGLLARQGISDGVSLAAAGKTKLILITSSLPADITAFVCSLAEAFLIVGFLRCLTSCVYALHQEVESWSVPLQRLGRTNVNKGVREPTASSECHFPMALCA